MSLGNDPCVSEVLPLPPSPSMAILSLRYSRREQGEAGHCAVAGRRMTLQESLETNELGRFRSPLREHLGWEPALNTGTS